MVESPDEDLATATLSERGVGSARLPVLMLTTGHDAGRLYRLGRDRTTTIGRARECEVCLPDRGLSRVHAAVELYGDDPMLVDRGSRNGTWIAGIRVEKKRPLRDGEAIALGESTRVRFSWVTPEEAAALDNTYESATRDGLTGVYNRKQLDLRLEKAVADAQAERADLSVIVLDIDHFKRVNDTYGHSTGDEVLRRTAAVLASRLRRDDVIGRYGGEEFVVIAEADRAAALQLADRLRAEVSAESIVTEHGELKVSVSGGVASLDEIDGALPAPLFQLADARLYDAKHGGRNRVVGGV